MSARPSINVVLRADDPLRAALARARTEAGVGMSEVFRRGAWLYLARFGIYAPGSSGAGRQADELRRRVRAVSDQT